MIYRLKHGKTCLDFASAQSAYQLVDNYPPHLRQDAAVQEITSEEIIEKLTQLGAEIQKHLPVEDSSGSQHYQWLLSRIEWYQAALPTVEQSEYAIDAKVANLPTVG